jgi:hypothetical protein
MLLFNTTIIMFISKLVAHLEVMPAHNAINLPTCLGYQPNIRCKPTPSVNKHLLAVAH